ncbi:MAG: hypothetical protein QNJ38_22175 [Prochloraceae cyanobacterium]|nr:hypothetical protein [Prochloraceae cyanobacterium]
MDSVIKESMRVLPAVPWNWIVSSGETELGGYQIPAKMEILVN